LVKRGSSPIDFRCEHRKKVGRSVEEATSVPFDRSQLTLSDNHNHHPKNEPFSQVMNFKIKLLRQGLESKPLSIVPTLQFFEI
jgi:hypothetical protein